MFMMMMMLMILSLRRCYIYSRPTFARVLALLLIVSIRPICCSYIIIWSIYKTRYCDYWRAFGGIYSDSITTNVLL